MITSDKCCEQYYNDFLTELASIYQLVYKYGKSLLSQLSQDYLVISSLDNFDLEQKDSEDLTKYAQDLDKLIVTASGLNDIHEIGLYLLNNTNLKKESLSGLHQKITQLLQIIPELTHKKSEQLTLKIQQLY